MSSGPGSAFLSESISQYGAVIALEEMLGPEAAVEFLQFSRAGYIPLQSARGFFEVIRRGADTVAIANMADISGMAKRIVVDSKGTWIYHMLRERLGDERFFNTLRSYLRTHSDGSSTLKVFRDFVVRAAPEAGIDGFFAEWLDRTGAPHLDVSWTASAGRVNLVIAQTQAEGVYTLDLDVLIEDAAGVQRMHAVQLDQRRQEFQLPFAGNASTVTVDPAFKILRWDEVYRRRGGG
jgi:hypothetical protein